MPACSKELQILKSHAERKNTSASLKGMAITFEHIDPIKSDLIQKIYNGVAKKYIKSSHSAGQELVIRMA